MSLQLIGLNHRTAPVEVRERFNKVLADPLEALTSLYAHDEVEGCVMIVTCNRCEVYLTPVLSDPTFLVELLSSLSNLPKDTLESSLYHYKDEKAIHHLFRLCTGLDSQVVGEPQIFGQVKEAFHKARRAGTVNTFLERVFQRAFHIAKKARTDTGLGEGALSIAYVAVTLAKKVFGELSQAKAGILGAGEMAELTALHLKENQVGELWFMNRTFEKAQELASRFGGKSYPWENLRELLPTLDILLTSTGAPNFVISADDIAPLLAKRRNKPFFMVDMAVPRDVDPQVGELPGVFLYNIDDLEEVLAHNRAEREQKAGEAELIILEHLAHFVESLQALRVEPTLRDIRKRWETLKEQELLWLKRRLRHLSEEDQEKIAHFAHRLVNKLLHIPTVTLKNSNPSPDLLAFIRKLFGVEKG